MESPIDHCPHGQVGDRLWVRESFTVGWFDGGKVLYRADGGSAKYAGYPREPIYKPSIHMPRWASRITLEIAKVRVERVQEISAEDAKAEGALHCLKNLIDPLANRAKLKPMHWIHGSDQGLSFCLNCAEKKVKELRAKATPEQRDEIFVDGGWSTEEDSQQFCDTCHCALECSFTDYAVEEELDHFSKAGVHGPLDAYSMQNILGAGVPDELSGKLAKVGYRFLWDSIPAEREYAKYAWSANPWVWCIDFAPVEATR
jgi:hypothetical protein